MRVTEKNGKYHIEHENGIVEHCESLEELHEVCHTLVEALSLLRPRALPTPFRAHVGSGAAIGKKKKLRLTIAEPEIYTENKKDLV